jgi:alpha-glucuronidase
MEITIVKNSDNELIITQQRRLTVTGSMFCVPAVLLLFNHGLPFFFILSGCALLWMIVLHCFYKGVTYTIKANKADQTLQVNIRSIFRNKKRSIHYSQVHHVIMAESHSFLPALKTTIITSFLKRAKIAG